MLLEESITVVKKIEIDKAIVSLREDGIMQYNIKPHTEYSVRDVMAANDAAGKLGSGKAYPNIIFIDHFLNADADCRKYAASEESNVYTVADAFVLNSVALKLIGNFYIKVNKPVRPTRIFSNEQEAIDWLYSFL